MATSVVSFARACPDDARLLLTLRPQDLLDARPDADFRELQRAMNAPLEADLRRVARALHGRSDARALDAVLRATVDLPYGVVRRHAYKATMPRWLERDVADATRQLLTATRTQPRAPSPQRAATRDTARSATSHSDGDEVP
jgi:hypothetical protein